MGGIEAGCGDDAGEWRVDAGNGVEIPGNGV